MTRSRRFAAIYLVWILLCFVLFVALRHSEDPARRHGRILSNDAADRAVAILRQSDRQRFHDYQAVSVAYAGRGEAGDTARWVVLCDRVPHTALREAIVVELDAASGALLGERKPAVR
jgi:uncharacterized membrane protein YdfJ with MMPL/SSD domain